MSETNEYVVSLTKEEWEMVREDLKATFDSWGEVYDELPVTERAILKKFGFSDEEIDSWR
jgi:hypothetical protein